MESRLGGGVHGSGDDEAVDGGVSGSHGDGGLEAGLGGGARGTGSIGGDDGGAGGGVNGGVGTGEGGPTTGSAILYLYSRLSALLGSLSRAGTMGSEMRAV